MAIRRRHVVRRCAERAGDAWPGLFMNLLLRLPIYVKTQRVLLPGARRTVSTTARLPVRATLSFRASRHPRNELS